MGLRVALAGVVLGACSTTPDPCLADRLTISQGVYGLVFGPCGDIGGPCPGKPDPGQPVATYAPALAPQAPPVGDPLERAVTDGVGFYELTGVGDADLCVGVNPQCARITVASDATARWDWAAYDNIGDHWTSVVCK